MLARYAQPLDLLADWPRPTNYHHTWASATPTKGLGEGNTPGLRSPI